MELFKEYAFEAAHWLPYVAEGHKCGRLHGHSYRIGVHIEGPVDPTAGWVVDFADISRVMTPIVEELDHRCLNEVDGLENPTSEIVAQWLWRRLSQDLPGLKRIVVRETSTSGCSYAGQ